MMTLLMFGFDSGVNVAVISLVVAVVSFDFRVVCSDAIKDQGPLPINIRCRFSSP